MPTMITSFFLIIFHSCRCFQTNIYSLQNLSDILLIPLPLEFDRNFTTNTMETAEYWLMACKYAIWNAAITSLQFWAEDLDPITLSIASEHVYTTFFWTPTSHTLCQLPEDVLFGCFVIALNAAFTQQLTLADEGYESGSDASDLPMPLWKTSHTPCIQHGPCILQPCTHYTPQYSYHNTLQFTTNPYQTSALPPIIQL